MENVAIVKQGYENFAKGNLPGILAIWDENIKWIPSKSFPIYEGDGIVVGAQNVIQQVLAKIPELYDDFHIDIQDMFESGNKVVMQGEYIGTWKETGKAFKANAVHIWEVVDGKAKSFFQAVDTASIMHA